MTVVLGMAGLRGGDGTGCRAQPADAAVEAEGGGDEDGREERADATVPVAAQDAEAEEENAEGREDKMGGCRATPGGVALLRLQGLVTGVLAEVLPKAGGIVVKKRVTQITCRPSG